MQKRFFCLFFFFKNHSTPTSADAEREKKIADSTAWKGFLQVRPALTQVYPLSLTLTPRFDNPRGKNFEFRSDTRKKIKKIVPLVDSKKNVVNPKLTWIFLTGVISAANVKPCLIVTLPKDNV